MTKTRIHLTKHKTRQPRHNTVTVAVG